MQQIQSWQCAYCGKAWSSEDSCVRCEESCKKARQESDRQQAAFEARRKAVFLAADNIGATDKAIRLLLAHGFNEEAGALAKRRVYELDDLGSGYVWECAVEHVLAAAGKKEASNG